MLKQVELLVLDLSSIIFLSVFAANFNYLALITSEIGSHVLILRPLLIFSFKFFVKGSNNASLKKSKSNITVVLEQMVGTLAAAVSKGEFQILQRMDKPIVKR
jgi:hypothetical protein